MAKKTAVEIEEIFKKSFMSVKGERTSDWDADDSANVALPLIQAQTSKDGKDIKLTPEQTSRIQAAMQITPKRIVKFIKNELEAAGATMDDTTEEKLLWLFDLPKVRKELVDQGIFDKTGKGKRKQKSVAALLK